MVPEFLKVPEIVPVLVKVVMVPFSVLVKVVMVPELFKVSEIVP